MTAPEADVILACQKLISEMKTKPDITWTRGHQDTKKKRKYEDLKDDAQLNIDMDNEHEEECTLGDPTPIQPLQGSGAMLSINGRYVTTNYNRNIQEAIMISVHKKYFVDKYKKNGLA